MITRNKKSVFLTGFVGMTAATLVASPAMAAPLDENTTADKDNSLSVVFNIKKDSIDKDNRVVGITHNEFTLPKGYDEKSFELVDATPEDDSDVVSKDVIEDGKVVGKTITISVKDKDGKDKGEWTYTTDLDGNFLSVEFAPAKDFTNDTSIDYTVKNEDGEKKTGTLTFDYPDNTTDSVVDAKDENKDVTVVDVPADAKDDTTKNDSDKSNTDEKKTGKDDASKTGNKDTAVSKDTDNSKSSEKSSTNDKDAVKDSTKDDEIVVEDKKENNDQTPQKRMTLMRTANISPAAPAAGPKVPDLTASGSKNDTTTLEYGKDGKKLGSDVQKDTVRFVTDKDTAELSDGGKTITIPNEGTWKVVDNGFTFTPEKGVSKNKVSVDYIAVGANDEFSEQGKVSVNLDGKGNVQKDSNTRSGDVTKTSGTPTAPGTGTDTDAPSDTSPDTTGDNGSPVDSVHTGAEMITSNPMKATAGIGAMLLGVATILFGRRFGKSN